MVDTATDDALYRRYAKVHRLAVPPVVKDDEFIRPLLAMMAEQFAQFQPRGAPDWRLSTIRIGFIDAASPNAFVDLWQNGAFICIYSGMLRAIVEAGIQMQGRIGAFNPRFEDKAIEPVPSDPTDPIGMTGYLNWLHGLDQDGGLYEGTGERVEEATWRATHFVSAGVQFVALHEFAHVANGHLGWLKAARQPCRLFEAPEQDDQTLDVPHDVRRFFEHEADIYALEILLRSTANRQLAGHRMKIAPGDELLMCMLSFLTTVFGWMTLERAGRTAPGRSHPLAGDRLFGLPLAVLGLLEQQAAYEQVLAPALDRCRIVLQRSIRCYPRFAPLAELFSPQRLGTINAMIAWMQQMDEKTADRMLCQL